MLSILLLTLLPSPAPLPLPSYDDEVAARIAEVGEDVEKLVQLAEAYNEADDRSSARAVFERILEIDPENEVAHKGLRHHNYDGKWFTSYAALSKYRREEAQRMKEEFGLVRHNDEWVPEVDLPFIRMGWVKDDQDRWVSPYRVQQAKMEAEYTSKGWQQREEDSTWVEPIDFDLWTGGMYRVEDEWFTKEEADAYHSDVANPWQYIGEHFVCRSTLPVEWTSWARWHADQTYDDLVRIYGVEPEEKPIFGVLNSLAQYNNFAAGDQAAQRQPTESTGFSSLHYAHIADIWFDIVNAGSDNPSAEYVGGGIAFWDVNDPAMKDWGPYAVRHAAALSYAENIDRAWEIVSQFLGGGGGGGAPASIWDGKKLPPWLVYGAACYVERYYEDKENTEDPWGKRRWAIAQVTKDGEPHSLESIFQLPLDINDIAGSTRYILESGLLVSFIMDGGCEPVRAKHEAFRTAFLAGEDPKPALAELQQAVLDNEDAFRAFAGLGPKPAAEPASETVEASAGH